MSVYHPYEYLKDISLEECPFCHKPGLFELDYESTDWKGDPTYHLGCSDYDCIAYHMIRNAPIHEAEEFMHRWNERK